jgi:hypothetical protein
MGRPILTNRLGRAWKVGFGISVEYFLQHAFRVAYSSHPRPCFPNRTLRRSAAVTSLRLQTEVPCVRTAEAGIRARLSWRSPIEQPWLVVLNHLDSYF